MGDDVQDAATVASGGIYWLKGKSVTEKKPFASEIDNLRYNNRFLRLMTLGLMSLVIIMALGWWRSVGNERTILVPPELHKTVWVDSEKVSKEYLEEMAYFMSSLILTASPDTVKYQGETLLRYVAPEARGAIKASIDNNTVKLAANSASTIFHPSNISFGDGQHAMKVVISGTLTTYVADKKVEDAHKTFLVEFLYRSGKVSLKTFKEVVQNDPFGDKSEVPNNSIFIQR